MENLTHFGTIVAVDPTKALVQVQIFERVSDWIPYPMVANSLVKVWIPPQVGEQVSVIMVYGEDGYAIGSVYNTGCREPTWANATTAGIEFSDGTLVIYSTETQQLTISCVGKVSISAKNGIYMQGDLIVSGEITDHKGTLSTHTHTGVTPGGGMSGVRP